MRILVIAPHPDDEVLGCGGSIAKYAKKGNAVHLCIATKAYTPDWSERFIAERKKEIEKARKVLGISKVHLLDLPTAKLDTVPQKEINDLLSRLIDKVRPELCFIPSQSDLNKDHRIIFESSLVALRPLSFRARTVLSYECLSETEWGSKVFQPNVFIDISATLKYKISAMRAYRSELRSKNHPRSIQVIQSLARKRGSEIGCKYAESFNLVREIL